ncbi:MAG: 2'-5' RNA ligase family protein, partial [Acidobacteriota bacterium]
MNRYLLLGLVDEGLSETARRYQEDLSSLTGNGLALRFPVHVTLRGPFWTHTDTLSSMADTLRKVCTGLHQMQIALRGPIRIDPDLCWLEVQGGMDDGMRLFDLHAVLEREMSGYVIRDDVSEGHKGSGYRPHVTVGWGVDDIHLL